MLIDFKEISDDSRLWIYGSDRSFTNQEKEYVIQKIEGYLKTWKYHNNPLRGAVNILENHFIIIALDDSDFGVGGCSIDGLQRVMQEIEEEIQVSMFNRLNIFCRINDKIQCIPLHRLNNIVSDSTFFYDLTIQYKRQLDYFLKPIKEGWCSYLFR